MKKNRNYIDDDELEDEEEQTEEDEDDEELVQEIKPKLKAPSPENVERQAIKKAVGNSENQKVQIVEREVNLSLLNDKLNFIISLLQKE